jgi:hypothetical protein
MEQDEIRSIRFGADSNKIMSHKQHTFINIKSSELSATQSHLAVPFPIPPLAAKRVHRANSTGSKLISQGCKTPFPMQGMPVWTNYFEWV